MAGQGFASMTKTRLREAARKGGKNANKSGTKHQWSKAEALEKAAKGVRTRMKHMADAALKRLAAKGLDPVAIAGLGLSDKEIVFYGGRMADKYPERLYDLKQRLSSGT